jgi:hypothetical protein
LPRVVVSGQRFAADTAPGGIVAVVVMLRPGVVCPREGFSGRVAQAERNRMFARQRVHRPLRRRRTPRSRAERRFRRCAARSSTSIQTRNRGSRIVRQPTVPRARRSPASPLLASHFAAERPRPQQRLSSVRSSNDQRTRGRDSSPRRHSRWHRHRANRAGAVPTNTGMDFIAPRKQSAAISVLRRR